MSIRSQSSTDPAPTAFVIELLNSAVEALADAVSVEAHPLLKGAKDIGSAAVLLSIAAAAAVWMVALL